MVDRIKLPIIVNLNKSEFDIYCGRPGPWGNPFSVEELGRDEAIDKFRVYANTSQWITSNLHLLYGKRLGCFCYPKKCHCDVYVEMIQHRIDQLPKLLDF